MSSRSRGKITRKSVGTTPAVVSDEVIETKESPKPRLVALDPSKRPLSPRDTTPVIISGSQVNTEEIEINDDPMIRPSSPGLEEYDNKIIPPSNEGQSTDNDEGEVEDEVEAETEEVIPVRESPIRIPMKTMPVKNTTPPRVKSTPPIARPTKVIEEPRAPVRLVQEPPKIFQEQVKTTQEPPRVVQEPPKPRVQPPKPPTTPRPPPSKPATKPKARLSTKKRKRQHPDFSLSSESEQVIVYEKYVTKLSLLRKTYPAYDIPVPTPAWDANMIADIYEDCLFTLYVNNTVNRYKIYLLLVWYATEAFFVKLLGIDLRNFAASQLKCISLYENMLTELGESRTSLVGSGYSVETRLFFMYIVSILVFFVVKYLAGALGESMMGPIQSFISNLLNGNGPMEEDGLISILAGLGNTFMGNKNAPAAQPQPTARPMAQSEVKRPNMFAPTFRE